MTTSPVKPDRYAVFGNPIKHSKSPEIHAEFARQTGENIVYTKELVELDGFHSAVDQFFASGGCGLNITVPFKEEAFQYADYLTDRAKAAEAVNTLAKQPDGQILGDNTDGAGLVNDLTLKLGWKIDNARILLLGAGGAVKGVLLPLLKAGPKEIVVANRTVAKAEALAEKFSLNDGKITACGFQDTHDKGVFDLIINGTSSSLSNDVPPISTSCLSTGTCVYDMVYGDSLTPFLNWAKDLECDNISDGSGMLKGQAAESFFVWRNTYPAI